MPDSRIDSVLSWLYATLRRIAFMAVGYGVGIENRAVVLGAVAIVLITPTALYIDRKLRKADRKGHVHGVA